jgi:hypothetical protein
MVNNKTSRNIANNDNKGLSLNNFNSINSLAGTNLKKNLNKIDLKDLDNPVNVTSPKNFSERNVIKLTKMCEFKDQLEPISDKKNLKKNDRSQFKISKLNFYELAHGHGLANGQGNIYNTKVHGHGHGCKLFI